MQYLLSRDELLSCVELLPIMHHKLYMAMTIQRRTQPFNRTIQAKVALWKIGYKQPPVLIMSTGCFLLFLRCDCHTAT